MTSLRSLLGIVTSDIVSTTGGVDQTTKLSTQPSKDYFVEYISAQCGAYCQDGINASHAFYEHPFWTVPTGVTDILFEIWGAGGGGAGGCCCSRGVPGHSGAFAYTRLSGNDVVPGCCYNIVIGRPGDAFMNSAQCGCQGGSTYITGFGLTNFCADGGRGGCSICNAGCCTWYQISTDCACFYGAQGGSRGNPGASYICCTTNHCWNKQFIPYPGGLVNSKGGWLPGNMCEDSTCGFELRNYAVAQLGWGGSHNNQRQYVPGVGGASAWVCGGGCCCGTWGTPGLVRISYK